MRILGVIIAGGRSSRMGAEKLTLHLAGRPILDRLVERLKEQTQAIALNINGDPARISARGLAIVPDAVQTDTPLAGLHAAFRHAQSSGYDAVLSVPSDAPFVPLDLAACLSAATAPAAIAASGERTHFLTGLWTASEFAPLDAALAGKPMRVRDWATSRGASVVRWRDEPFDPFFNVNTREDLAEAERIAAQYGL